MHVDGRRIPAFLTGCIPLILFSFFLFWLIRDTLYADRYGKAYSGEANVLSSDPGGYYAYLPAAFIYDFHEPPKDLVMDRSGFHYVNDTLISKYPLGLAIGELPFFAVAHAFAERKDGYSRPYHIAIRMAGVLYGWLGLLLCFLFFRKRTRWWIALAACAVLFFGTNLRYYVLREPGASHVFSFFLVTLFFYLLDGLPSKRRLTLFLLFPVFTLLVAVRPADAIVLVPAIFWKGFSRRMLSEIAQQVRTHQYLVLASVLTGLCFFLPQLLYNHFIRGNALMTMYPGESFTNWYRPRFDIVLASVSSGLFVHTPVFILFTVAVVYGCLKKTGSAPQVALFLFLALYLYAAWYAPDLGCSFGHRGQVDFLLFWALPFALLLDDLVTRRSWWALGGISVFVTAFILYTGLLTHYWWFCSFGNGHMDYPWFFHEVKTYWYK